MIARETTSFEDQTRRIALQLNPCSVISRAGSWIIRLSVPRHRHSLNISNVLLSTNVRTFLQKIRFHPWQILVESSKIIPHIEVRTVRDNLKENQLHFPCFPLTCHPGLVDCCLMRGALSAAAALSSIDVYNVYTIHTIYTKHCKDFECCPMVLSIEG